MFTGLFVLVQLDTEAVFGFFGQHTRVSCQLTTLSLQPFKVKLL